MSIFKKIFSPQAKPERESSYEEAVQQAPVEPVKVQDDGELNPFTEMHLLLGHKDIIRLIVDLGNERIATCSDDTTAIVWHVRDARRVCTLTGHTRPITSMLPLNGADGTHLLTASSDKSVRMWDPDSGKCTKTFVGHTGTIKCMSDIDEGILCFAGRDISTYSFDGQLLASFSRYDDDSDIHHMLQVMHSRIVTASDDHKIVSYNLEDGQTGFGGKIAEHTVLSAHREAVRCLVGISDAIFASGSLDGTIVLWSARSLTPTRTLNLHEEYMNKTLKTFPYAVHALMATIPNVLVAAVGCGFQVYEANTARLLFDVKQAHLSSISHVAALGKGGHLITCSIDGSIRVWALDDLSAHAQGGDDVSTHSGPLAQPDYLRTPHHHGLSVNGTASGTVSPVSGAPTPSSRVLLSSDAGRPPRSPRSGRRSKGLGPRCIGEMVAHTDSVNHVLECNPYTFASCASDKMVILWRVGLVMSARRNAMAADIMRRDAAADAEAQAREFV